MTDRQIEWSLPRKAAFFGVAAAWQAERDARHRLATIKQEYDALVGHPSMGFVLRMWEAKIDVEDAEARSRFLYALYQDARADDAAPPPEADQCPPV
jgi:hypothetical protein